MSVPSYESILQAALNRVSDNLDKREGSVIYDAIAAAAFVLHEQYIELERKLLEGFAGTCSRKYLILRAQEVGMNPPYQARASVVEAVMTPASVEIPVGTRFNCDKLNFFVLEEKEAGVYLLQCETTGPESNLSSGTLLPIDYVEGLQSAAIRKIAIYGEEEQDTEEYRDSYFVYVKGDARDGNVKQYELWTTAYPGIGHFKVLPLWNGRNTVKVSILDKDNNPASDALIKEYQTYLDPESKGMGNGIAPIGAIVTVSTATEKKIDLSGRLTLTAGYTDPEGLDQLIKEYLHSMAYTKSTISYMAMGALILSCPAIDSLSDLRLNGEMRDITLATEEIAVYGEGDWVIT